MGALEARGVLEVARSAPRRRERGGDGEESDPTQRKIRESMPQRHGTAHGCKEAARPAECLAAPSLRKTTRSRATRLLTQHRATAAPRRATTKGSFLRRGSQDAAKALSELTVPSRAGRSGYLLKQGVGNRAWKSRWFVLPGRDQLLLYYEDSRNSIVPKRIVRVVGPVAARPEAVELNGHAGYAFDVWAVLPKEGSTAAGASQQQSAVNSMFDACPSGTAGRIQYRLAAPTEAEAQEWLDALRRCPSPMVTDERTRRRQWRRRRRCCRGGRRRGGRRRRRRRRPRTAPNAAPPPRRRRSRAAAIVRRASDR